MFIEKAKQFNFQFIEFINLYKNLSVLFKFAEKCLFEKIKQYLFDIFALVPSTYVFFFFSNPPIF